MIYIYIHTKQPNNKTNASQINHDLLCCCWPFRYGPFQRPSNPEFQGWHLRSSQSWGRWKNQNWDQITYPVVN